MSAISILAKPTIHHSFITISKVCWSKFLTISMDYIIQVWPLAKKAINPNQSGIWSPATK